MTAQKSGEIISLQASFCSLKAVFGVRYSSHLWYTGYSLYYYILTGGWVLCQGERIRNSNCIVLPRLCWKERMTTIITMPEIMSALGEYEITADRKSIYNDLRDLETLGIEVE